MMDAERSVDAYSVPYFDGQDPMGYDGEIY